MNSLLEKIVGRCFPEDEFLRRIVRQEYLKSNQFEKQPKVDTLAMMVIKSIMRRELIVYDTDTDSQGKLIFKEPIDFLDDYSQRAPEWKPSASFIFRRISPLERDPIFEDIPLEPDDDMDETFESEPIEEETIPDEQPNESEDNGSQDESSHQYLTDGEIVFALLNQEIPRFYDGEIGIVVTQNNLQISINWHFIAVIPHRDGIEYDSFWAEKFLKMMLPKYPNCVAFDVNKEGPLADLDNDQEMPNYVDSIVAKLPQFVPPEGWEQYISIDRPVYHKDGGSSGSPSQFGYSFNWHAHFRSHTVYSDIFYRDWFCLGEE